MFKKAQFIILMGGVLLSLCFAFRALALTDGAGNEVFSSNVGIKTMPSSALDVNGTITTNGFKMMPTTAPVTVGNVLTATASNGSAAWASSSGSGTKVLISTQTADNTSNGIEFISLLGSTYDRYLIEMYGVKPSSATPVQFYMRVGTGTSYLATGTSYGWTSIYSYSGGAGDAIMANASSISFIRGLSTDLRLSNVSSHLLIGDITFITPAISMADHQMLSNVMYFDTSVGDVHTTGNNFLHPNTTYNSVRFSMSSGNISTGTFKLYGLL